MDFGKYVESILPSLGRNTILDDLDYIRKELNETVIPPYDAAVDVLGGRRMASKTVMSMASDFDKKVKTSYRGNMISVMAQIWHNTASSISTLEQLVEKSFSGTIAKHGLTYAKANILQHIEATGFALRYARRLLLFIYACETSEATGTKEPAAGSFLTKPEREWLSVHYQDFLHVLNILAMDPKDMVKAYASVPDAVIDPERLGEMKATVGTAKLDPMRHGFIASRFWPVYHLRMKVAEWQVARRDAAAEELRALEFRLLNIKNLDSGKRSPKVEQEIEYTEDRISKLNRTIEKLEAA